ncbi:hypothetical protein GCM10010218_18280 [Streptomyces mashuensis]|uniref:RDD family protein n=1 Tax=Streptomyces mashuensis TaxID=33904 RepID=A0A919B282_9ACTN|nr:RDD family protein [Streptomyces mashuensis]GHF37056.1 hypothetical protein GCM10010218_18280 [Streptomyces mashuensis]
MPGEGYYPDPSIPGYIRYWSGTAWVPGTSRPAPAEGEPMPAPPASVAAAAAPALAAPVPPTPRTGQRPADPRTAEETGPVFLDEEPRPADEPTAWKADTGRQEGFGGERDRRVSWGGAPAQDPRDPRDPRSTRDTGPAAGPVTAAPGQGTLHLRPKPHGAAPGGPPAPLPSAPAAPDPGPLPVQAATAPALPQQQSPQQAPQLQAPQQQSARPGAALPVPRPESAPVPAARQQPGGWARQVQELAQQGPEPVPGEPVTPWKPPAEDPFSGMAQTQGRPASLGRRLVARLLDTAVLGGVTATVAVPLWNKSVAHIDAKVEQARQNGETVTVWLIDGTTGTYLAIVLAVLLVGGVLYEALPTAKWGRTLGKRLCGVRVLDIEGHDTPGAGAALRRWLVYGVLGVLVVGVLNVLWCLFDRPWRQCWHDKAARTFVASAES